MSYRCGSRCLLSLLLLVTILCAGCVSSRGLAKSSVQFNRAVEQGQNQMLLMNIIRASFRRPMYLTSFAKVTGSNSASLTAGFNNSVAMDTVGGSVGANPTFDVPVLDSQEFTSGFLKPIDPRVLAYYWDQDWPEDFVLHLMVHKVRVRVKTNKIVQDYYFWNHPDLNDAIQGKGLCKLEKFTRWVRHFTVTANPGFQKVETKPIGPAFQAHQVDLDSAVALTKEGLSLAGDDNRLTFDLRPAPVEYVLQVEGDLKGGTKLEKRTERYRRELAMEMIAEWAEDSRNLVCDQDEFESYSVEDEEEHQHGEESPLESRPEKVDAGEDAQEVSVALFLRSPEAILYYLGQLVRIEERLGWVPRICVGNKLTPLFVAHQADPSCANGPVTVEYDYRWYAVPGDPAETMRLDLEQEQGEFKEELKGIVAFEEVYTKNVESRVEKRASLRREERNARKDARNKGQSAEDLEKRLLELRANYRSEHAKYREELRTKRGELRTESGALLRDFRASNPEWACVETDVFWEASHLYQEGLGCDPGRSMQALSLITQIINLQKSAKDLPTTGTVRVVGQ